MQVQKGLGWVAAAALTLMLAACGPKDQNGDGTTPKPGPGPTADPADGPRRAPPPPAELTAVQVIDKAIAAHGGLAALKAKMSSATLNTKGTYAGMPYTSTVYFKAPTNHVMVIHNMGMQWGTNATECWQVRRKIVFPCTAKTEKSMRKMHTVGSFGMLAPLKMRGIILQKVSLAGDDGQKHYQINASKGDVTAHLYIDKKTFRVNRMRWKGQFGVLPVEGEMVMHNSRYKTMQGVTFPTVTKMSFNGKMVMSETVTSAKLGQVDEAMLKKPAQLAFGAPQEQAAPAHHTAWRKLTAPTKTLKPAITKAMMGLYAWAKKNGVKALPGSPTVRFLRMNRRKTTVELRFPVMKPAKAVKGTRKMGLKAVKAEKIVWALQQGDYTQSTKWLKALKKKLRKQRRRIIGKGGMQSLQRPNEITDPNKALSAVFYVVRK